MEVYPLAYVSYGIICWCVIFQKQNIWVCSTYINKVYGIATERSEGVLMESTTQQPPSLGGIASEASREGEDFVNRAKRGCKAIYLGKVHG